MFNKIIEVKNVMAFLKARGWTFDEETETHYLMKPPKEMKTEKETRFYLVTEKFKDVPDYHENMLQITKSIAGLYDLDFYVLQELFSKTPKEIKEIKEISTQLLANVA